MITVTEAIVREVGQNPLKPCLVNANRAFSYQDVLTLVTATCRQLELRGLARGRKVFVNIADADFRFIVTIACLHYGLVPFVLQFPAEVAADADFDFVIGAEPAAIPEMRADLLLDQAMLTLEGETAVLPDYGEPAPDDLFFVGSTSGTTGRPKLVATSYQSFQRRRGRPYLAQRVLMTLGDLSRPGFSTSLNAMTVGGTIVRPAPDIRTTLRIIQLYGVGRIHVSPGLIDAMIREMDAFRMPRVKVGTIALSGALIRPALLASIEKHFDAQIEVSYGSSEIGSLSRGTIKSEGFRFGYVGELRAGVSVLTAGTREKPAAITLLYRPEASSPYYSKGRLIRPDLPYYTMPDLGYLEGTSLFLAGRDDEVFNAGGNKVAYGILEVAIREIPGVDDVGLVNGIVMGEPTGLIVALVGPAEIDLGKVYDAVAKEVKSRLPPDSLRIVRLDRIPRNALGKVNRQEVAEAYRKAAKAGV